MDSPLPPALNTGSIDLQGYLQIIRRHKLVIILPAIIITTLFAAYKFFYFTPQYQTSAEILRRHTGIDRIILGANLFDQSPILAERELQSAAHMVKTPDVVAAVKTRLAKKLADSNTSMQVQAEPINKTNILSITATSSDPALAADIANSFAEEYIKWQQQADNKIISQARTSIETQLAEVKPDQNNSRYRTLTEKLEALKLVEAMQISDLKVVKNATPLPASVSSAPLRPVALALVISLFSGLGLVVLLESFDTKVRSPDEIPKRVEVPVLGIIPHVGRNNGKLIKDTDYNSYSAEAYRLLKTNLAFVSPDKEIRSILVTSPAPGEGKSTATANLAVTMARAGQRVMVLEADLRRPRLAEHLGLDNNTPGLTSVLFHNFSLLEAAQRIDVKEFTPNVTRTYYHKERYFKKEKPNLGYDPALGAVSFNEVKPIDFITAGPLPPDPGEIVASAKFDALIAEARDHSDMVLIDTPPMGVVGDAASLAAKVDGVILVMRMATTTKKSFDLIRNFSESIPCNILGIVVTDAATPRSNGYQYGYYRSRNGKRSD